MREIDLKTWERKSHYQWFSSFSDPSYGMNVRLDVTRLLAFCKEQNTSSFATIAYAIGRALGSIQAFRYRILEGKIWELDRANLSYTVSVRDEYFVNNRTNSALEYHEFCRQVRQDIDALNAEKPIQEIFNNTSIVDDIYLSCCPWIDFLSITQPMPDNMPESSSIPRVCWGKYTENNGKTEACFNITVNHALVDGKDLAEAFLKMQELFHEPERLLSSETE